MNHFELRIIETARNCLRDLPTAFNGIIERFDTIKEVKDYLVDRYGHIPAGKGKVYTDDDGESKVIGFLHSFWNKNWSYNSKFWYQTDWITITDGNGVLVTIN